MTVEEFRTLKPEYQNVDGDELWNAMEDYMLLQQEASETIKQIMPIWKTHTLRWLFYRKVENAWWSEDGYKSDLRCATCKKGVASRFMESIINEDGTRTVTSYCPHHGRHEYSEEPNTNLNHRLYKIGLWISTLFWNTLDKLHLVRSSIHNRYDMFGDESRYVSVYTFHANGKITPKLKTRKWWEYILIERSFHNF